MPGATGTQGGGGPPLPLLPYAPHLPSLPRPPPAPRLWLRPPVSLLVPPLQSRAPRPLSPLWPARHCHGPSRDKRLEGQEASRPRGLRGLHSLLHLGTPPASGDWAQGLGCRVVGHTVGRAGGAGRSSGADGAQVTVLPIAPWDPQGGPSRAPPLCVLLAQMRPRCSSQSIHQIIPLPGCWDKPPRCVLSQPGARMSRVRACRAAGEAPGLQMAPRPVRPLLVKTLLLRAVLGSEQIGVAGGETSPCPPCPPPHPPPPPDSLATHQCPRRSGTSPAPMSSSPRAHTVRRGHPGSCTFRGFGRARNPCVPKTWPPRRSR